LTAQLPSLCRMVSVKALIAFMVTAWLAPGFAHGSDFSLEVRQITFGPQNHLFGYIGHVQNIPWNGSGRFVLALRTTFQDRMPGPEDAADVVLIDTHNNGSVRVVDECRGWNPQQGTMFYWNPKAPETQFFFNDRDRTTGKVFCVLFDISEGSHGSRQREYRYDDTPVGNSGVAQNGGYFLAINYARMARLRPVTGYKGTFDWTIDVPYPGDDGVFKIEVASGKKELLVSFQQIADALRAREPGADIRPLFINHTLWNREDDRVFFFARAGWTAGGPRINTPFTIRPDGRQLVPLKHHIGGHPEWDFGQRMIGRLGPRQIIFDVDRQLVIGGLGSPDIFPSPEGDIALSPNGKWFVNGHMDRDAGKNYYTVYRRHDGAYVRSTGFEIGHWTSGDLRQDPSPCWNRKSDQILVPSLAEDGSRQLFVIQIQLSKRR
jgi:hypothetical protein